MAYENIKWLHLRVGQLVHVRDNPRHVGRVEAVHNSVGVKVRWLDSNWISFESAADLERTWER
jgi:hypothetical protein